MKGETPKSYCLIYVTFISANQFKHGSQNVQQMSILQTIPWNMTSLEGPIYQLCGDEEDGSGLTMSEHGYP